MHVARIGAVAALAVLAAPVLSEEVRTRQGTVIELFTSQGCSACPPADALLQELAERPGVIALSLHVDYWDYIGWTDSFGQPRFTERQKSYARAEGSRTIYTPQMIVAGGARVAGVDPAAVEAAVAADRPLVPLGLVRKGDQLLITAAPLALEAPLRVQLVRFTPKAQVMIETGENAGRLVDYANVVTSWAPVGEWDGRAPLQMSVAAPGPEGVVVILQTEAPGQLPGRILGAAQSR